MSFPIETSAVIPHSELSIVLREVDARNRLEGVARVTRKLTAVAQLSKRYVVLRIE